MEPTSAQRTTAMTDDEMQRVISEIPLSRAHTDPSACILALKPLLLAKEGRRLLMNQARDEALILIELFDWALKSHENTLNLNKGYVLWTLRQLCASQETLPRSCILPIEFKTSDPHHAAGGFADVWKGTYEGIDVAFKTLRRSTQVDDATRLKRKRRFCKEVILWKSLNHQNILGLVGVCRWDNTPEARLTMVSPWMSNGNITEYTKNNACQRMQLLIDCARGVQHIHRMGLVHGDLKGANILITSDNPVRACLADFGFTTIVNDDPNDPGITSALGGGTVPFMAPELLCPSHFNKPRCQVSKESDVYAFGMVILQVLTSLIPFRKLQHTEISYKVIQGERPKMPEDAQTMGISQDLWDLLDRCWLADSTQRPRIEVVFQHLSNDPARGTIFPPWKIHPSPSEESLPESGTQKYVFYTADQHTPVEDYPPFSLPRSPVDLEEYPSNETRDPASSLFSVGPQDLSAITSPGNSQTRSEAKPPESETLSRMASNMSNSTTIVADSTDDLGTSSRARNQGWVAIPRGHGPVFPQHDYDDIELEPTIYDTSHVDLTQVLAQGPPRPGPLRGKPRLQITTIAPVRSRNSNSPGTAFYTPGGSGEVVDRRPFDSAAAIRVIYSTSSSRPSDSAGPFRRVVRDVLQGSARYQFPIQRTPVSRSDPRATTDAPPRHGFRTSFLRPPRNVAGSPRFFSGASASTTPGHESGLSSGSRLASLDEREDVGTSRDASIFPRMGGKRVVPSCDGGEGTAEDERTKKGKETDDWSHMSSSTDYVDVVEESSQGKTPTSVNTVRAGLRRKSGASASTTPGSRDPSTFPQGDGRRVVPSCDGREGTAEDERTKKGIEIDDCSHMSNSTDYVSVSGEVEESSQDKAGSKRTPRNAVSAATQRPSFESSPIRYLLKKITRKPSKPQHCAQTQVQNDHPSPSMSMATIESIDTPVAGSGQGRERKFSEISTFLGGLVGAKKKGSKRDVRLLTKSKR